MAQRIRRAVARLAVPAVTKSGRTEVIRGLSISIGVAPYPEIRLAVDTLIGAADTALGYAKELGRNQVWLATPG